MILAHHFIPSVSTYCLLCVGISMNNYRIKKYINKLIDVSTQMCFLGPFQARGNMMKKCMSCILIGVSTI